MSLSEPLEILPPISGRLYRALDTIQTIITQWWPEFRRIEVSAAPIDEVPGARSRTSASFFSGGVDSFYTCLKHTGASGSIQSPPLTHLVCMEGVEHPLEECTQAHALRDEVRRIAEHYELEVVFGRTNIRSAVPVPWGMYYHGAGLASIGHSLAAGFSRTLIPSTHSFRHLFPWGSHPLLDPLWSTEQTEVVHDGSEAMRVEKTALVASDAFALEHLRVCTRNGAGPGNCGRCTKCLRTMVTLQALGELSRAKSFPAGGLPVDFSRRLPLAQENDRAFVEEIVSYLEEREPNNRLARELSWRLRQTRRRAAARSYVHNSALEGALPAVRVVRGAALRFASILSHIT
ncbi:MAG TPA: hypothetical protein VFR95_04930 [Gemmatimonadaceae bacterium]|nr:hypothetical protein [Gemmatimonadaceae bacterium]